MRPSARTSRKSKRRDRRSHDPIDLMRQRTAAVRERELEVWRDEVIRSRLKQSQDAPLDFLRDYWNIETSSTALSPGLSAAFTRAREQGYLKMFGEWIANSPETKSHREAALLDYTDPNSRHAHQGIANLPKGSESRAYLIYHQELLLGSSEHWARSLVRLHIEQAGGRHKGFSLEDGKLLKDQPYHDCRRLIRQGREDRMPWTHIEEELKAAGFKSPSPQQLKRIMKEEEMIRNESIDGLIYSSSEERKDDPR